MTKRNRMAVAYVPGAPWVNHELLVLRARLFATAAHSAVGQVRKYTDEPYWVHPGNVAFLLLEADPTDEMIAAAWLHDVIEDTKVTLDLIVGQFGPTVAELVDWLTDKSKPEDGNRAARKAIDRARLAQAPAEAQTIKLADMLDNGASILKHDPDFAKVYLAEMRELLDVMTKGDPGLMARARRMVEETQ